MPRRPLVCLVRRLLRLAVAGACLVSLLACLGTGWLWWHRGRVFADFADAAGGGVYVAAWSTSSDLSAVCVGRWPGRATFRASSLPIDMFAITSWPSFDFSLDPSARHRAWGRWGAETSAGQFVVAVDDGGSPVARPISIWSTSPRPGEPTVRLQYADVTGVRHEWVVAATAMPPGLWLGTRARRAFVTRRRHRLGLCRRCGYDVRASGGRCSECAEPIPGMTDGTA